MSTFDVATKLSGTNGNYAAVIDPEWSVNGNPHGGYLLALLANAAIDTDGRHPHPVAASAIYVSRPLIGDATVGVETLRQGRTASQLRVRMTQDGVPRVEALVTLGSLGDEKQAWVDSPPVEVAPRDQCPRSPVELVGSGVRVAMLDMVDQRIDGFPSSGGSGEVRGWLSFADGAPFDPVSLLYAADSFPPATLTLGSIGWVPTLELTVYVRAVPVPGPLRVRQRVRALTGSVVDQVCEIWDAADRVVVQASQLALVRMPAA